MSTTSLTIDVRLRGKETLDEAEAPAALTEQQRILSTGKKGLSTTFTGSTTPKIDQPPIVIEITLGGSPTVIDLTAVQGLVSPAGLTRTLDMTGAKLVSAFFDAYSTNAGAVNIAPGGADPYPSLFGSGNDIDLAPGEVLGKSFKGIATTATAVGAGAKNISVSGTSGDKLYVELYFGT